MQATMVWCYVCGAVVDRWTTVPDYPVLCETDMDIVRETAHGAQQLAERIAQHLLEADWAAGQKTLIVLMLVAKAAEKARLTAAAPRVSWGGDTWDAATQ